MIGMILGNRYEIIKEIGSGGMANVYLAQCRLLNRHVAVKILKSEFVKDQEFLERFKKEAQAAAAISSPNIVGVHDVGHDGDIHYIVMEYVEGQTLKEYIDENGMLSWQETVEYAIQICSALDKAHKNNIVHRDIKPQNIILTNDGVLKVTDFGIARATANETLNVGESTMGSVHYFSPEQARGGYTDAKSDIYSLGVVMYEMVTGVLPFTGDTPVAIAIKHMQQKPINPKEFNISVPLAVESIILKAMSKEQSLRYQTANDMLTDLQKVANDPIPTEKDFQKEISETIKYEPVTEIPEKVVEKEIEIPIRREYKNVKREDKRKKSKKKMDKGVKNAILMAIISAVAVFGLVVFLAFSFLGGCSKEFEIPEIVGMSYEEAVKKYGNDFEITIEKNVESDKYPEGYIVEQDPAGGRTTKSKKAIKVSVTKSSESFVMGDYEGKDFEFFMGSLQKEIDEFNITLDIVEEASKEFEKNKIIKTIPAKNKKVEKGDIITVYVSMGKSVEMPDLIGKTLGEAREIIATAGLELKNYSPSNASADYIVEWQSIDPYTEVLESEEINLRLKEDKNDENDNKEPVEPSNPVNSGESNNSSDSGNSSENSNINPDVPVSANGL